MMDCQRSFGIPVLLGVSQMTFDRQVLLSALELQVLVHIRSIMTRVLLDLR